VTVYTLGHSTVSIDAFVELLEKHAVRTLVDVRRFPGSRRHPHFGQDALAAALAAHGVDYVWLPALGGRRKARADSPHTAWRVDQFRGYADHMETDEFASGLGTLLALARERTTAVMCAEATHWRCHRQLLADALAVRGVEVVHLGIGRREPHRLTRHARTDGTRIIYDRHDQGRLPGT
jgi:uncharacterized protein (DUF488 family)